MKKHKVIVLLFLIVIALSGCQEEILHDLDEMRANQALLILERAQIHAEKVRSGKDWLVRVAKNQALEALSVIDESRMMVRDLDRKEQSHGLMQSREDRAQANERQLAWDLESTLERIPGVREAKVHLSIEADSPLTKVKTRPASSASVLLVIVQDDAALGEKVKQLIAGAAGLPLAQISVVLSKIEEPIKKVVIPQRKFALELLPILGAGAGTLCLLLAGTFVLRRMRRRPKTLSMLADSPLRPQMSFPDSVQIRREEMEMQ